MEKSVRVAVRVRPLNDREKASLRPSVVSVAPKTHQVTVRKKTYTFDRVFGQYATQKDIFKGVVQSVVDEALAGFNCTVFAYGQTGTGKTHTIQGKLSPHDENAGIIPRSVNYIFEKLQATKTEYSVRVSFLQLYNEELKDLLGDNKKEKPLRLMEDPKRGGIYCQNLEEVTTLTASHVFDLLEVGSKNRIMAETLLNDHSSRSHCIFTIRIHSKESNIPGEEMIRSGTLNLVDLAGSECIGRSGARNARAREAGNINQSLLTLGRVITALVDKHPHVPYRDSKLTRLLQESLGGRAMTTVIATLGPAADCIDETVSTLDYAHRAKSIKNKPEANQRTAKNVLIKEYGQEIDALRSQLMAARAKDGIFLPPAQFTEMQERIAGLASQLCELEDELERKTTLVAEVEEALESANNEVAELDEKLQTCQTELASTKTTLEETEAELSNTKNTLSRTEASLKQSQENEAELRRQAEIATKLYHQRLSDIRSLQEAVARKDAVLQTNNQTSHKYAELASTKCSEIATALSSFKQEQTDRYSTLKKHLVSVVSTHDKSVGDMTNQFKSIEKDIAGLVQGFIDKYESEHEQHGVHQKDQVSSMEAQSKTLGTTISSLTPLVEKLSTKLNELISTSLASANKITSQVENECQIMQQQMEAYTASQDKILLNLQNQLAQSLNDESKKMSNDAAQLVNALQTTKDSMAQRVAEIQSSLKQQLDQCLESVLASLTHESLAIQERSNSTSDRLVKLLTCSSKDIEHVQSTASDAQARLNVQTNETKESMNNYLKIVKSESATLKSAISDHAQAIEEYKSALMSDTKSNLTEMVNLLDNQANKRAEQFDSTTQWMGCQFTDLQQKQEKYVNLAKDSAKYIENECSELSNNVEAVAVLSENHTSSMVLHVKDQNEASSKMIASISMDKPTGSTPRKPMSAANFPSFEVAKQVDPLPQFEQKSESINPLAELASPRRKSEALKSVNPLAELASPRRKSEAAKPINPLAELASPKRKLEDPNGSRLQPPKKYSKTTES